MWTRMLQRRHVQFFIMYVVLRRHHYYGARRVAAILRAPPILPGRRSCFFGCYLGCCSCTSCSSLQLSLLRPLVRGSAAHSGSQRLFPGTLAFSKLILVERAPGAALFELILLRGHPGVGQLFPIYWSAGCMRGVMAITSHKSALAPCSSIGVFFDA